MEILDRQQAPRQQHTPAVGVEDALPVEGEVALVVEARAAIRDQDLEVIFDAFQDHGHPLVPVVLGIEPLLDLTLVAAGFQQTALLFVRHPQVAVLDAVEQQLEDADTELRIAGGSAQVRGQELRVFESPHLEGGRVQQPDDVLDLGHPPLQGALESSAALGCLDQGSQLGPFVGLGQVIVGAAVDGVADILGNLPARLDDHLEIATFALLDPLQQAEPLAVGEAPIQQDGVAIEAVFFETAAGLRRVARGAAAMAPALDHRLEGDELRRLVIDDQDVAHELR